MHFTCTSLVHMQVTATSHVLHYWFTCTSQQLHSTSHTFHLYFTVAVTCIWCCPYAPFLHALSYICSTGSFCFRQLFSKRTNLKVKIMTTKVLQSLCILLLWLWLINDIHIVIFLWNVVCRNLWLEFFCFIYIPTCIAASLYYCTIANTWSNIIDSVLALGKKGKWI